MYLCLQDQKKAGSACDVSFSPRNLMADVDDASRQSRNWNCGGEVNEGEDK
jgi:hypothetical protein